SMRATCAAWWNRAPCRRPLPVPEPGPALPVDAQEPAPARRHRPVGKHPAPPLPVAPAPAVQRRPVRVAANDAVRGHPVQQLVDGRGIHVHEVLVLRLLARLAGVPVATGEPLALGDGPGQEGVLPGGLPAARPEALVYDVVGAQRIAMAEHDAPAEGLQDDGFLAQLEAGPLRIALDDRRIGLAT